MSRESHATFFFVSPILLTRNLARARLLSLDIARFRYLRRKFSSASFKFLISAAHGI